MYRCNHYLKNATNEEEGFVLPEEIKRSRVSSSGFLPVTVKYWRWTVSRCSAFICWRSSLKPSKEFFSFFLREITTEVRDRSEDEPGPQPGRLRWLALARSSVSNLNLMSFAVCRASATSASMAKRRSFTALPLWRVLPFSWDLFRFCFNRSTSFSSSVIASTLPKYVTRLVAPSSSSPPPAISMTLWPDDGGNRLLGQEEVVDNKSCIIVSRKRVVVFVISL